MTSPEAVLRKASALLQQPPPALSDEEVGRYVRSFTRRADEFLRACSGNGSPLYVIEEAVLAERARRFITAFRREIGEVRAFYALKSNNHPAVAACLVRSGLGLDVSGGPELEMALSLGCREILFSGPGKTDAELRLAVANRDRMTILTDSFGELRRLGRLTREQGAEIRVGVRLTTQEEGLWRKFGIPLGQLGAFAEEASRETHVRLCGLQFHTSWNLGPSAQTAFIARLGRTLKALGRSVCTALEFIDIGGGYWPSQGEWLQWAGTQAGQVTQAVMADAPGAGGRYKLCAEPIETFAREIGSALREHIFPHADCRIYTEPGRWLCNDAMHMLMTVVDKKADDIVIVDAGTHNIGWERFETDYAPVINLTRPSPDEHRCFIFGSLCTPHDVWGYGYFGSGIEPGDILMVPGQGAYTYSLRQNFIKPLAKVISLAL